MKDKDLEKKIEYKRIENKGINLDIIKELYLKYKDIILYIVFGVLTTLVNLGSFFVLNTLLKINENVSNFIAIILAVLAAYFTNKDMVFHSAAETRKEKFIEFCKFILGRIFTMIIEFVGGIILFKLPIPYIITKTGITVVVVILNFFISKFFAFKKNKANEVGIKEED